MQELAIAAFLSVTAERLIDGLITPLFDRYEWDKFILKYVAWLLVGGLVYAGGINLFEGYLPNPLLGQILTAVVGGGGANLIHDQFDKPDQF